MKQVTFTEFRIALSYISDLALQELSAALGLVPEGARLLEVEWDVSRRAWCFAFEHPDFAPVQEGCLVPTHAPGCIDRERLPAVLEAYARNLRRDLAREAERRAQT